jgi:hypothetical protein
MMSYDQAKFVRECRAHGVGEGGRVPLGPSLDYSVTLIRSLIQKGYLIERRYYKKAARVRKRGKKEEIVFPRPYFVFILTATAIEDYEKVRERFFPPEIYEQVADLKLKMEAQ